jgi:hypothetical protein
VVVRGKYKLTRPGLRELALAVDLRLPTGDVDNMLGTGATQTQVMLVTSYSASRFDPHFNVGYTFANKNASDQINYVAGMEVGATQRLTLIADVIGRSFLDTLQLRPSAVTIVSPGDPSHRTEHCDRSSGLPASSSIRREAS